MEPTEENVRAWEKVHRDREAAALPPTVLERLPDLNGRHVLHLGCGAGAESVELAELGAFVTGVDLSEERIDVARGRSTAIAWVHADVHALPVELLRGRFDLVYTRALNVVQDPHAWAMGISAALKPRGYLLLHARHPVVDCLDASLRWREDYFSWPGVGHVVTAVARAGLQIRRVEELAATDRSHDKRVPSTLVIVAAKPHSAPF
jgi:predicted TPR repeat methyltransferase